MADTEIFYAGSGCIAALEAEKFLAESETEESTEEHTKQKTAIGTVKEYRPNPLL